MGAIACRHPTVVLRSSHRSDDTVTMTEIFEMLGAETYRVILDSVGEGVFVLDRSEYIVYWNAACEMLTGFGESEAKGSRCSDELLKHVDAAGRQLCLGGCPMRATLSDGEPREAEVYLHHRQGHRVPVHVHIRPLRAASGRVVAVVQSFRNIADKVAALEQVKELEDLAYLDPLTGIANRRFLERSINARLDESRRHGWNLGLMMIDVDHFKAINDTYGHDAGDQVLRMVAETLRGATRSYDLLGRWGGEEFVVVLTNTSARDLADIAERYRALVERSDLLTDGHRLQATISIGATLVDVERDSLSTLLARADRLLYTSKDDGRNRVTSEGTVLLQTF
jgi:diguanylate cyclase (GGDEF)-like protein/PAS domain S-box-containing protein